jgi:hypothetical protein
MRFISKPILDFGEGQGRRDAAATLGISVTALKTCQRLAKVVQAVLEY